jgi:expansin (peptidoglycan-binding protein)
MGPKLPHVLVFALIVASGCTTTTEETPPGPARGAALQRDPSKASPPAAETTPALQRQPGAAGGASAPATVRKPLGQPTKGIATFYDADGTGNCSFPATDDRLVVAPNKDRWYAGSAICGACMRVTGAQGSVVVRVVDSCPIGVDEGDCGDSGADLDLSAEAFAAIDDPDRGIVDITFEIVPCDVNGPIRVRFKSGSSASWTAVQIQNHRLPIATVEYAGKSGWVAMQRDDDDFFVEASGVGRQSGGLKLRVTASTGDVIEETVPGILSGQTWTGTKQFP